MLLSMILMIVASAVQAKACEHMTTATALSDHQEASSPKQGLADVVNSNDVAQANRSDAHDVDVCVPRCCQSNVCCHVMTIPPAPDFRWGRGENVMTFVATDGTPRSTEPDVPPPKAV